MNSPKRNRNSLVAAAAAIAAVILVFAYIVQNQPTSQPDRIVEGSIKSYAKGALAAFLVKPARPAVPDITFQDGKGAATSISQWRGRVVLLNLWATWCAPCRKEMPDLADLQRQLGSADFEVVALSIDRKGLAASAAFLQETGADNLGLYIDQTSGALQQLEALGLPVTLLIDRQGREIGRLIGPAEWNSPEALALIRAAVAE